MHERHARIRQIVAIETGPAVHLLRSHQRPHQGSGRAGEDVDVGAVGQLERLAGVLRSKVKGHVARDRRHGKNFQLLGRGKCHQDGNGVIRRGIGIEDNGASHRRC